MPDDPIGAAKRSTSRRTELGEAQVCVLCGRSDLDPSTCLELHHVPGRNYDSDVTAPLCVLAHRLVTEGDRDAGIPMEPPLCPIEREALRAKSVGRFLIALGQASLRRHDELLSVAAFLADDCPGWAERYRNELKENPDD